MTDKEITDEIKSLERQMKKISKSPIMEHPEDYDQKFKQLKKDKKVGKRERILYFMIVIFKTATCSIFASYRTRVEEVMKKCKVDPEKATEVMLNLPTSYSYGTAFSIEMYDKIKKLIDKEIKEDGSK